MDERNQRTHLPTTDEGRGAEASFRSALPRTFLGQARGKLVVSRSPLTRCGPYVLLPRICVERWGTIRLFPALRAPSIHGSREVRAGAGFADLPLLDSHRPTIPCQNQAVFAPFVIGAEAKVPRHTNRPDSSRT